MIDFDDEHLPCIMQAPVDAAVEARTYTPVGLALVRICKTMKFLEWHHASCDWQERYNNIGDLGAVAQIDACNHEAWKWAVSLNKSNGGVVA